MSFSICDMHCDTISSILDKGQELYKNSGHIDIQRLKEQNVAMQFFAAWIDPIYAEDGFARCNHILDKFDEEYEKNQQYLHLIRTAEDIDFALANNKIAALLSVEGGEALNGDMELLYELYQRGVRLLTLTWNGRNALADGIGVGENAGGLTSLGQQAVRQMNSLGMIVDVSHISEKGFWDVAECANAPFIASHSNAKAICSHPRNLNDEQIQQIIQRNGFIGINLCSDFLRENESSVDDIIAHVEHFLSIGAQDVVGFGADFDGVDKLPQGISGVESMQDIIENMLKMGYSEQLVEQITFQNAIRATKEIMNFFVK